MEQIKADICDVICTVDECLCAEDRHCSNKGTDWEIRMCSQCALQGAHVMCSGTVNSASWTCFKCRTELADVPKVSTVNERSSVMCSSDDPDQQNHNIEPSVSCDPDQQNTSTEQSNKCFDSRCSVNSTLHSERPYKCEFRKCNKSFFKIKSLQKHTRKHTGKKQFECVSAGCEEHFNTLQQLTDHQAVHTNVAPYKCRFHPCNASYVHTNSRRLHEWKHTTSKLYTCSFDGCSASFTKHLEFQTHQRKHTGLTYKCKIGDCTEIFQTSNILKKHMQQHNKSYTCPHERCGAMFGKLGLLLEHKKLHWDKEKVLSCDYEGCFAFFLRYENLVNHQQKHQYFSNYRRYKCTHVGCTASFKVPYGLQVHMRRHQIKNTLVQDFTPPQPLPKKNIKCKTERCRKTFQTVRARNYHMRYNCDKRKPSENGNDFHQHTSKKPYTCLFDGCSASFIKFFDLKSHEREHSGITYNCKIGDCTESFQSKQLFKEHIQQHNNSYPCPHDGCSAMFGKPAQLQEHKKLHWDKEKVLSCEYEGCGAFYIRQLDLTKHQQKHQSSVRSYKCTHGGCTASFQVPYGLQVHMRRHQIKNTPD